MTIRKADSAAARRPAQRTRVAKPAADRLAKPARRVRQAEPVSRRAGESSALASVALERRFAVIMAGGSGTRFWPWSREARPKQLLKLTSDRSMLAETVARLDGVVPRANIVIVAGRKHRAQVLADLPGIAAGQVLAEPVGRNTAACIAWATAEIVARRANAVAAVFSADHLVGDTKAFARDLDAAFSLADLRRCLVTFGVAPATRALAATWATSRSQSRS